MYSTKSVIVCLLVMVCMVKQSSSFCQPFNKTSGLAQVCGYTATANFTYTKHYNIAVRSLLSVVKLLSSCSEYAKVIACSVYTPRCEANIEGPYLPCKRVCDEFNRQCRDQILRYGMEWIIGMCQVLPEKDDPNTKLGYRGRCFEPPNFKTNLTKSVPVKCSRLIVPICQHIGYAQTVLPEDRQRAYMSWASRKINSVSGDRKECTLPQKRFFCMENFPPCFDDGIGFYCRPKCEDFLNTNCSKPLNYKVDICMEMPKGRADNDVCKQTHWPRAENWPQVRDNGRKSTPTATPSVISLPPTTKSLPTTKPAVIPFDASAIKGKKKATKSKAKVAPVVGGVLAGICVIALAILIAYMIYRNKKRAESFPYDKQVLYNEEVIEMTT